MNISFDILLHIFSFLTNPNIFKLFLLDKKCYNINPQVFVNVFRKTEFKMKEEFRDIECLENFLKKFKIKILNLNQNPFITDNELKYLKEIKSLNIYNCKNITGKIFENFSTIEELNMNSCRKIKDQYVKDLKTLKFLNIGNCNKITDDSL